LKCLTITEKPPVEAGSRIHAGIRYGSGIKETRTDRRWNLVTNCVLHTSCGFYPRCYGNQNL